MHRVIFFNNGLSGGAGKAIITVAKMLKDSGVDSHIIIFKNSTYPIPENLSFHKLKVKSESKRVVAEALKKKLQTIGKFDIVFSNSTPSNKILSLLNLKNSYHIVHSSEVKTYRGFFKSIRQFLRKKKYQRLYNNKNLITVSKGLEETILKKFKATPKTIQTVYNAFDFENIERLSNQSVKDIPEEPFIVHIGRYDISSKRQDILLKAYKKSNIPHKLYLIGDGEDRDKIQKIVDSLNLNSKVVLYGFSSNPYPWIKKAKLLTLSSDFEGFVLVLVEALFLKTPVVSTDALVSPKEILGEKLKEFLVPRGDIESLSKKMVEALKNYPNIENLDFKYLSKDEIIKSYIKIIKGVNNVKE